MSAITQTRAETITPTAAYDVPIVRISPDNETILKNLGLLRELAGAWRGSGFNLIARPDAQNRQNLYLQLNQTHETLKIDPIGSSIPNRGFGQNDIELFGLTYLQKINDIFTGGALHIEPGIWITQPPTSYPPETAGANAQIVARMGNIPHGNALLAQGVARPFAGNPVLKSPLAEYAFSDFPSFNSTPFAATPQVFNAAGSSEKLNAAAAGVPPFTPYDLSIPESATNPRTPLGTNPPDPALPPDIDGVPMQTVVNDPITLLQAVIDKQVAQGCTFEGTVINISTQANVSFRPKPNDPNGVPIVVSPKDGAGGIENIPFLEGENVLGSPAPNADTATVYATFWIEKVMHNHRPHYIQLQYAQMVVLNFPIFTVLHPDPKSAAKPAVANIGWPHVSVATLTKSFN